MDTRKILAELRAERTRIEQAIAAIEAISNDGAVALRGRPKAATSAANTAAKPQRRRRRLTAAGRKRLSEMMKQRWAERKKSQKPRST
jgi:hypothetical protein